MKRNVVALTIMLLCLTACGQRKNAPIASTVIQDEVKIHVNADPNDPYQALVGQRFVDVEVRGMDGRLHRLSEYIGANSSTKDRNYVLVDFWASWCRPCMMEMPNVKRNWEKYKSQGFNVVGISLDKSREAWLGAIRDNGYSWTQLSDLNGFDCPAVAAYYVQYIPWNFLCDSKGVIVAVNLREGGLTSVLQQIYD